METRIDNVDQTIYVAATIQKDGLVRLVSNTRIHADGGLAGYADLTKHELQVLIYDLERVHDEMIDYRPTPDYADIFDLESWGEEGAMWPQDGHGYWLMGAMESSISCFKKKPEWATGVSWYNK